MGLSWLCFYKAIQISDVSRVSAIDKSSLVLTILFAMFLGKAMSAKVVIGGAAHHRGDVVYDVVASPIPQLHFLFPYRQNKPKSGIMEFITTKSFLDPSIFIEGSKAAFLITSFNLRVAKTRADFHHSVSREE